MQLHAQPETEVQKLHTVLSPRGNAVGKSEGYMARVKGTIKRLVTEKGFGFIGDEGGVEYFFHRSACADRTFDQLREGQSVSFDVGQGPKGPRAENVRTE
jgi:CspA family cold shock protein